MSRANRKGALGRRTENVKRTGRGVYMDSVGTPGVPDDVTYMYEVMKIATGERVPADTSAFPGKKRVH